MAAIDTLAASTFTLWARAKDVTPGTGITTWPDASPDARACTYTTATGVCSASQTPLGGNAMAFGTAIGAANGGFQWAYGIYTATSELDGSHRVGNAFDGNTSTTWHSVNTTYPMNVQMNVAGVATEFSVKCNNSRGPGTFKIQGWDGSAWNDLYTGTSVTWTSSETKSFSFSNSTSYSKYRFNVTGYSSGDGYQQWESVTATGITLPTYSAVHDGEVWIVVKSNGGSVGSWDFGESGQSSHYPFSGTVYEDAGSNTRRSFTPSMSITAWRIYRVRVESSNWTVYLDGTSQVTNSSNTRAWQPYFDVGAANGQQFAGWIAEVIVTKSALSSGDATIVNDYLTYEHFTTPPTTASANLALSGTATPAGVATASASLAITGSASGAGVATTSASLVLSGAATAADSTVATASAALTLAGTATAQAAAGASASLPLSGTASTGATAGASASLTLSSTATAHTPGDTTLLDFRIERRLDVTSVGSSIPRSDVTLLTFGSPRGLVVRNILSPTPPPLGVLTEWPLQRQAHLMAALSAANPKYRPELDYDVDYAEGGRLHVFVGGEDYTYKRGVPVAFDDYSSGVPFGPQSARISMPQVKPWDETGTGDLAALDMDRDPAVEIALVRPDDSVEQIWEGFLAVAEDRSGEGFEDYTFSAEGLFAQAAHQPWNPPVFMEPTDPGWIVADALNAVVARRWSAIPRVTTGLPKVRTRGTQAQSVWQYVQDVLSKMWSDDGRQWTLARVAPYTYRLQLKTVVTDTDWTFTKGAPGVEVNLSQDQSQRRDCIFGRGIAPDGGVWGNWFFPGLDKFLLPLYPMAGFANMSVGTTDADTTTGTGVTDWQRRMRELGFPVTVDGVMNSADTNYVKAIQRKRGITVDGSLGPQTWAATFDNGVTDLDLSAIRLPLAAKPDSEQYLYSANGSVQGTNPLFDSLRVRHAMTEVDYGPGVTKAEGREFAERQLARDGTVGWSGTIQLVTDPHEAGSTRFDIRPGHNVHIVGHRGGVDLQVSEVSVSGLQVTLTVDERARDALTVDAILDRNREAQRDPSARVTRYMDKAALNRSDVVQYESESQAGFVPRVAINGNSGLWTVLPIFVSQVGVAKIEFTATEPKAEIYVALFEKPITANQVASFAPDPSASREGWFENIDALERSHGLLEVFGTPQSPGGYWPWEKADGHGLTGRLRDRSSSLYASQYGGFIWVAMFTSVSTWVQGRVFPAVPQ